MMVGPSGDTHNIKTMGKAEVDTERDWIDFDVN